MPVRRVTGTIYFLLTVCFLATNAAANPAISDRKDKPHPPPSLNREAILPVDRLSTSHHKLPDLGLSYQATAGALPVKLDENGPECSIFFISYHRQKKERQPFPLTFVFNGGPGASSAYLHLGALGPRRVMLHEDGTLPGPPAMLLDNQQTWLRFTDLVFVDPAGTGYSRCSETKDAHKGGSSPKANAWGVAEDLNSLAKFIRLYLTRFNRWLSPKYLVGESYGGFRAAALSDLLQTDYDISLNGIILVSPVLEFQLLDGNEFNLLPWLAPIPSYAATARYHGKAAGKPAEGDENLRKYLVDAEHFALQDYLPALAGADTAAINSRLADLIGLPADRITRLHARIEPYLFAKELLQSDSLLISVYDGTFTSPDPDPVSHHLPGKDPQLVKLNTLLAAAFNSYVREELQFKTDLPYNILNWQVSKKWNWRSGMDAPQGFTGVAENLKNSMSTSTELRVLIAHGIFALLTPYFGTELVTKQMMLAPAIADHLKLKLYKGGHTFYTHAGARRRFYEDAEQFYAEAMKSEAPEKTE